MKILGVLAELNSELKAHINGSGNVLKNKRQKYSSKAITQRAGSVGILNDDFTAIFSINQSLANLFQAVAKAETLDYVYEIDLRDDVLPICKVLLTRQPLTKSDALIALIKKYTSLFMLAVLDELDCDIRSWRKFNGAHTEAKTCASDDTDESRLVGIQEMLSDLFQKTVPSKKRKGPNQTADENPYLVNLEEDVTPIYRALMARKLLTKSTSLILLINKYASIFIKTFNITLLERTSSCEDTEPLVPTPPDAAANNDEKSETPSFS